MRDFPIADVVQHAKSEYPKESCGLVIIFKGRFRYIPCRNIHELPHESFCIHPDDYANAEDLGEIVAVCHSHPDASAKPSQTDIVSQKAQGTDWLIVGLQGDSVTTEWLKNPREQLPLYGREYHHGVQDCYSFVQDYYAEKGILLRDYFRKDEWWNKGENLYLEHWREEGFIEVKTPEPGDAMLLMLNSKVPNHACIYLGDNLIGHHLTNRLSCRDIYGQFYRERTQLILRYNNAIENS